VGPEPITDLSRELAKMPEVWSALLARHRARPDGRCGGCRTQVTLGQRWPCTLYRIADRARSIAAASPSAGPVP
jgi:hypothetical protein